MNKKILCNTNSNIITPFSCSYNELRKNWNRAVCQCPSYIVYCKNKYDVKYTIIWAKENKIPIRIRNRGHNYNGYSNGNCVLIIDVSEMNEVIVDEINKKVYVEGGVNNGHVYEVVSSKGYPFPGGTCPTVGVSGYALGGGWGLSCRNFGLGCDNLEEVELVNYNGEFLKANKYKNQDLFWALRGAGGGNFGVVVSMTFKLLEHVENVTIIQMDSVKTSKYNQELFLKTWQNWMHNQDKRISLISRIYNSTSDNLSITVKGIFYGNPDEARILLEPFLQISNMEYSLMYVSFLEAVTIIGSTYKPYEKFQSASFFVYRDFDDLEISNIVSLIQKRAVGSVFAGISLYSLGGRVSEVSVDETSFFHRGANYIMWIQSEWEDDRFECINCNWIEERFLYLHSITKGAYVNFPYNNLKDYISEYYGYHKKWLELVKFKYDPNNIFSFPQGI